MSWDSPIARFSSGNAYYRRYTSFYGNHGNAAKSIVLDALKNYRDWESQIETWQNPILSDNQLPDDYKFALFNELYYLVDGGTIWTTGSRTKLEETNLKKMEIAQEYGHFAYLESLEYLMYNTYDVHFYASFALAMLWPKLELSLQRDVALATMKQYSEVWEIMHSGKYAARKVRGAVPHDMGNPGEDPWNKVKFQRFLKN
jgi:non-lysosomal glucosylceramidase